ncbi:MAG TPA: serine hydrolase [Candidatus Baltobacteraceae bacterium]|jgi:beta-lactamase class A|nr:serine hydrolase [Candidatus Baltobacteraceae bacterium]
MLAISDPQKSLLLAELAERATLRQASLVVLPIDPPGAAWTFEPYRDLYPASMIKVPIAAALTARWEEGSAAPEERVEITLANMTAEDMPSPFVPGYFATTRELCELMLTRSNNVAANVLIDFLGRDSITEFAQGLGLEQTFMRRKLSGSLPLINDPAAQGRNRHPAAESALLFASIAHGRLPGAHWLKETLGRQCWNDKLSTGLLPGDRFFHKTGETDEFRHDGGILTTNTDKTFVIVAYTALTEHDGDGAFQAYMHNLRTHL